MATADRRLRILVAAPAYWPAAAFGGPIAVLRELVSGLTARGHEVDVVTSSLVELGRRPVRRTTLELVDGARVHYAATPARFRWMGITPTVPRLLGRLPRPDVAHVFGFRDPVGTLTAAWCTRNDVPYAFEALGMYAPKLRKIALKRALDATVFRGVPRNAALAVAASEREADEYRAGAIADARIAVRPNGFPAPRERPPRPGRLRTRLGLDADTPLVLSVGRVARGKGLDLLLEAARSLPDVHVAIVGPDDRHGMQQELEALRARWGLTDRMHLVGPVGSEPPLDFYADADVFVLASAHENFGMVAAEAAAAGTASVVSDRCGIAELVRDEAAVVIPYDAGALRDALARLLADPALRGRLGRGGVELARRTSWETVVTLQESLYRRIAR